MIITIQHTGRPHLDRMDCLCFQACAAAQLRRRDGGSGALRDGRQPDAPARLGQSACHFQPDPCRVSDSARSISTFCVRRCWTVRVRLHWVWLRLKLRRQSGLRSEETKGIQIEEVVSLARAGLRSAAAAPAVASRVRSREWSKAKIALNCSSWEARIELK